MDYKKPQSTLVQGGVGLYPLTTADQVILADGSRLEKNGKISADSAADSAKLGGKAPEYYLSPRNLLDNSDFRNPVNQRGATSYSVSGYTIDRWFLIIDNNSITINDGNITIDGFLRQKVVIPDGAYTTACMTSDGTIKARTFNLSGSSITNEEQDGPLTYAVYDGGYVNIGIDTGTYVWSALYEGTYTAETLPPYVPKGYAAELAECRRYYQYYNDVLHAADGYTTLQFCPIMRITPTVTVSSWGKYTVETQYVTYRLCPISIKNTTGADAYGLTITASADL